MEGWNAEQIAAVAGAKMLRGNASANPSIVVCDSRAITSGALFVGVAGARSDGSSFAAAVLEAGAWGVLVTPQWGQRAIAANSSGAVLIAADPVAALGRLAAAWRQELGCPLVGITGSVGKTTTKDMLAGLLQGQRRTYVSPGNLNTEIGLPLALLQAPRDSEVIVLELAMRGPGQIAELAAIAQPTVGIITNVAAVHIELLGSIEAIAAAKSELLVGLPLNGVAVVPFDEPLLQPALLGLSSRTLTFGPGGEVAVQATHSLQEGSPQSGGQNGDGKRSVEEYHLEVELEICGATARITTSQLRNHELANLCAAVAGVHALGFQLPAEVQFSRSPLRGERLSLPGGAVVVNDCYNASPPSMRAALDDLVETAPGRTIAVLGDMLELGATELAEHAAIGQYADQRAVDVLITVGALAAQIASTFRGESHQVADAQAAVEILSELLQENDTVLVKASRGLRLERIAERLMQGVNF